MHCLVRQHRPRATAKQERDDEHTICPANGSRHHSPYGRQQETIPTSETLAVVVGPGLV